MSFIPVGTETRTRGPRFFGRIWAVGSRAYVHCPGPHAAVVLTDEDDRVASAALDDGVLVEVRAWLPRRTVGTRYHVRALDGVAEGWLEAQCLRPTREAPEPAEPARVEPTREYERVRRFGQR